MVIVTMKTTITENNDKKPHSEAAVVAVKTSSINKKEKIKIIKIIKTQ